MKISGDKKSFVVIMMLALVLHSTFSVGQKLAGKEVTGGTTDPSLSSPTENNEGEENLPAPASILNQRLPFSKPLKGQNDKFPSELQQQAPQGLSYQQQGNQNQAAVGGFAQPLSGPNQLPVQNIPFANEALNQKTSIIQAAMLVSPAAVLTVFLLSHR